MASFPKELEDAIAEAFGDLIAQYNEEVDQVIQSTTEFGDSGFDNQDIVDTGRFLDSKTIEDSGKNEVTIAWDPADPDSGYHYAAALWNGFFAYGGKKYIPGRHWAERAAYNMEITKRFAELLQESGLEAKITKNGDGEIDY